MNPALPISQQCQLLALPRSSVYRKPAEVSAEDLAIMTLIGDKPFCIAKRDVWVAYKQVKANRGALVLTDSRSRTSTRI
jgi:hypothetical protein